ncbi:Aste57867_17284 [Aphanomyces stellatus]|uniref:Aste57867_17284 protein n=1 Tax=Aphanomyces stellatus TaxID=120398 RepID=A0A485L991_9STRA|nr:hypothetical protein As57867_017225 [Aphanomyces stellatus]VFT94040.1 Aste57867_17284 [Aphanomyces stellatus]
MDSTTPLTTPPVPTTPQAATPAVAHPTAAALESLKRWIDTCTTSVFDQLNSEFQREIADTDILLEVSVMLAQIRDTVAVPDELSRAQTTAIEAYGDAVREMACYLESIHTAHAEASRKRTWFASVFSTTTTGQEEIGLVRALLRRVQKRSDLVLRVLAIPARPPVEDDMTAATETTPTSTEDLPIESTFIKLQKKYIQELALAETVDNKRHKRRRTLASFQSPSTKLP